MKEIARGVPYASGAGKLISSQKMTSHLPTCVGVMTTPFGVLRYPQYCSRVLTSKSGVVADEKLSPTTSICSNFLRALNKVIVFPEPGGPQRISGLCSANHE